ncbi:PLAC8 family protein [Phytophthora cinnamomi]|uniref:PLAC8 family protein n=1 Tax=Phytophthora cinnamomi TaxID=4785 RepID=UPI00355A330D|nr:PLAC8 family protein [Phytophthora cinnamomi]KAG6622795.1 PLAC8 family protein [Phytophthora cinnamomi]
MADIQKPPPTPETYSYPTVYATPIETVVYVEHAPGSPGQARQAGVNEQGVMVGAWSADFWGCFDSMFPNCCMVTFCPCVSLAQISERLGVAPYRRTLVVFLLLVAAEIAAGLYPSKSSSSSSSEWNSSTSTSRRYSNHSSDSNPIQSWVIVIVRGIFIAYVWHLRQTTRRVFRIPGGACGDCWSSFCCSCCAMAQIATHIKSYKPGDCSFGPPDVLPPYTRAQGTTS